MRRLFCRWLILSLVMALGACSSMSSLIFGPLTTELEDVRIETLAQSNRDHPTRIDLVFVYDESVQLVLPKTGKKWFGQKAALLAAYPKKIATISFELPPNRTVEQALLPDGFDNALAVLVYADYLSPAGQSVADLTSFTKPLIRLEAEFFTISEQKQ